MHLCRFLSFNLIKKLLNKNTGIKIICVKNNLEWIVLFNGDDCMHARESCRHDLDLRILIIVVKKYAGPCLWVGGVRAAHCKDNDYE